MMLITLIIIYPKKIAQVNGMSLLDKKLVILTFDDGPSKNLTSKLLDGLKIRGIHVTFFILGNKALEYPELVKRAYLEGHTIGIHSYNHEILTNKDTSDAIEEIEITKEIIEDITKEAPKYLRPPYGIYSDELLEAIDMPFIIWNIDTKDWRRQSSNRIKDKIIRGSEEGNIILLHDVYKWTIDGTFKAIDDLLRIGYAFVSIDEYIVIREYKIEDNRVYFSFSD